jgi:hypothetical protein
MAFEMSVPPRIFAQPCTGNKLLAPVPLRAHATRPATPDVENGKDLLVMVEDILKRELRLHKIMSYLTMTIVTMIFVVFLAYAKQRRDESLTLFLLEVEAVE